MRPGSLLPWVALTATLLANASGCGGQSAKQGGTALGGAGADGTAGSEAPGSGTGGASSSAGGSLVSSGGTAGKLGAAGSNTGGSVGDASAAGTDGGGGSGGSAGEPSSTEFPAALSVGVWLVGWSGGLDHYSWIRFTAAAGGNSGTWQARDAACQACTPYLPCSGAPGTWSGATPRSGVYEITLTPPVDCADQRPHVWKLVDLTTPDYPPGAELAAHLTIDAGNVVLAERYPSSACDPTFTTCAW